MARAAVHTIYFDADEIIETHGACHAHLQEHIKEAGPLLAAQEATRRRSAKIVVRMRSIAIAAVGIGILTAIPSYAHGLCLG